MKATKDFDKRNMLRRERITYDFYSGEPGELIVYASGEDVTEFAAILNADAKVYLVRNGADSIMLRGFSLDGFFEVSVKVSRSQLHYLHDEIDGVLREMEGE